MRPQLRGDRRAGLALVVLSAASFATLAIFGKRAYAGGLNEVDVLVARFGLAAPVLWAMVAASGRLRRLPWRITAKLLLAGAVGYAVQATLFFAALSRIPAGMAGLLLYLYPALVTAGAVLLGRHRLDRWTVAGLALALAGTALVVGLPAEHLDTLGVLLGLASAFWYTGYILVTEHLLGTVDPLLTAAMVTTGAATSFLVVGAGVLGGLRLGGLTAGGVGAAVAMALVGTVVAIACFFAGMARVGSTWASIGSSFEPVCTVALGVLVLGEPLGPGTVAGGIAVVAGAVVLPLFAGVAPAAAADAGVPAQVAERKAWTRR